MARPVHYAAHGMGGLAFACYHRELGAYVDARKAAHRSGPATTREESAARHAAERAASRAHPMPRGHTDLRKVTCRECWHEINALAVERLNA